MLIRTAIAISMKTHNVDAKATEAITNIVMGSSTCLKHKYTTETEINEIPNKLRVSIISSIKEAVTNNAPIVTGALKKKTAV